MDRLAVTRRATQAGFTLLFLLMPVFDVLRYDVAHRVLYLFGRPWSLGLGERFYADPAIGGAEVALAFFVHAILPWLVVLSVFPLLGVFLGRFFCGWLCPEGALFEIADHVSVRVFGRRDFFSSRTPEGQAKGMKRLAFGVAGLALLAVLPPLFGVFLSGYFIAPSRIWHEAAALSPSFGLKAGVVGVSAYMAVTFVLVRHRLCKYVCAAGLMQMLLGWVSPVSLRVGFHREDFSRCTDCRRCEAVCFMDVKPRAAQRDINCVNCGRCITACRQELGRECGLFGFAFGEKGRAHRQEPGKAVEGSAVRTRQSPAEDAPCGMSGGGRNP